MKTRSFLSAAAALAATALGVLAVPAVASAAPPSSTPTMTLAALRNGVAALGATTAQTPGAGVTVRFVLADGTDLGDAPVTSDGATNGASLEWNTWGHANGTVTVYAEDCLNQECGGHADGLTLTLSNGAPTGLSPANNVTVRGGFTLKAAAPYGFGGMLRFLVDGHAYKDFTVAPYSTVYNRSLAKGWHTFTVADCDKAKDCRGPQASTRFYADSLHPSLSWISPSVLSPNGDHVRDTTKIAFSLPDSENVTVRMFHGSTQVWAKNFGALARGSHSLVWNGYNGHSRMHDGTYTVRVDSTAKINGVWVTGSSNTRTVRVDDTAPWMSAISGNHGVFYPVQDGYRDTFAPGVTLNEAGWLKLKIYDTRGHVLRTISGYRHAGRTSIGWSGYDAHGHRYAGTFRWTLTATDGSGNHRTTGKYWGTASGKRLVAHTVTYTKAGAGWTNVLYTDGDCTQAASSYPTGVWMDNVCDPYYDGFQFIEAEYHFTLPKAAAYGRMSVNILGSTLDTPSRAFAVFRRSNGTWDGGTTAVVRDTGDGAWYSLGGVAASGHGNPVIVRIGVDDSLNDELNTSDLDLQKVKFSLTYYTLG